MTSVTTGRAGARPDAALVVEPVTAAGIAALMSTCSPASLRRRFFLPVDLPADEVLLRYGRYLRAGPPSGAVLASRADRRSGCSTWLC
jgi:hypothetical protein